MISYDKKNNRLIVYESKASNPDFWEALWETKDLKADVMRGKKNYWLKYITGKYLKSGSAILEGGCGRGQNVYGLDSWGYDAYGVDFAFETIFRTQNMFPNLKVSSQDVRKLDFKDNSFDGYWSLGVIEHFWDGYDEILKEAYRVIKPGGYLFVTFPWMSPLRKKNALKNKYNVCDDCKYRDDFYQFILSDDSVKNNAERYGFNLVHKEGHDALKGIKYESKDENSFMQKLYDMKGIFGRGTRFVLSVFLKNYAGHTCLCVFRKK